MLDTLFNNVIYNANIQIFNLEKADEWFSYLLEVCFNYEERTKNQVLDNISFTAKKSENIAIVGPSGAGKSTLVDLIPRFYDVTDGAINIDGKNIKDVKLDSLRSLMGIVTQETFLFDDSVKANIAYGLDYDVEEDESDCTLWSSLISIFIMIYWIYIY